MKLLVKALLFISLFLSGCTSLPRFYPQAPPPENFTWMYFPTVETWLLHPAGWSSHHGSKGNCQAVCISKENVKTKGSFETGITLQRFENTQQYNGVPPDVVAVKLIEAIQNNTVNTIIRADDEFTAEKRGVKTILIRYRNAPAAVKPIIVHKYFMADALNLYAFTFESPEATWDEDWENFGEPIMRNLLTCNVIVKKQ